MGALHSFRLTSRSPEATGQLGVRLGELARPGDTFLLSGPLGAGKTCLTQGIARGLGSRDYAVSPTFNLVRELEGRLPLYHIDLYRLDRLEEIEDLGLDDYFQGNGVCVVEWAEKGLGALPAEHLGIEIGYLSDNERTLAFQARGERYAALLQQVKQTPLTGVERS
ncbi:MAG: tRNA (adenosine(37)-N6)-threonylcarbamoyltransferase complex ATPase subunit type 1 TsaE [Chloroflexota bacterium]